MSLRELEDRAHRYARAAEQERYEFQRRRNRSLELVKKRLSSPITLGVLFGVGFLAGGKGRGKKSDDEKSGSLRSGTGRVIERTAASMVTTLLLGSVLGSSTSSADDLEQDLF